MHFDQAGPAHLHARPPNPPAGAARYSRRVELSPPVLPPATWNGTTQESRELAAAIEHNCACQYATDGHRTSTCAPHRMLVADQRALDGLLFVRQIADRLRFEELRSR